MNGTWIRKNLPLIRRLVLIVALVFVALMVRRYDITTLPSAASSAMEGRIKEGAYVLMSQISEDTVLGVGSLVEARVTTPGLSEDSEGKEGLIISRIAAEAGMKLTFADRGRLGLEILVDGARTYAHFDGRDHARLLKEQSLKMGSIPEGFYLLLNPNTKADAWDSRTLGLVARDDLQRKVMPIF